MKTKQTVHLLLSGFIAIVCTLPLFAADQTVPTDIGTLDKESLSKAFPTKPPYSPYAGRDFPTRPFFGDTHVHTSFSLKGKKGSVRESRQSDSTLNAAS